MSYTILQTREYTQVDQQIFAELSGDFNPLHLDPIIARREFLGDVVVHGMHCVLDALEQYCVSRQNMDSPMALRKLTVKFPGAVYLNRPTTILMQDLDNGVKLEVCDAEQQFLVRIDLLREDEPTYSDLSYPIVVPVGRRTQPLDLSFDDLKDRQGAIPLYLPPERMEIMFPHLFACFPHRFLAELMAITRLVGMECPGLRSIFSSFELECRPPAQKEPVLIYKVARTDGRYALVFINICSAYFTGRIKVIYRPLPQQQASMYTVHKMVSSEAFKNHRALIVGGSRGLGEVTAKIIAAGGGHPYITYYKGRDDATRIADEIKTQKGLCTVLSCDINNPVTALTLLAEAGNLPDVIYYFASPKIFVRKNKVYSRKLYTLFTQYYIDGFASLYQTFRSFSTGQLTLFYPSSTALDTPVRNLAEYTTTKAAGENLCRYLCAFDRNLTIIQKRLPRIATDQTTTVVPQSAENALDIMIDIVREIHHTHFDIGS